jgi:hypothetical protein
MAVETRWVVVPCRWMVGTRGVESGEGGGAWSMCDGSVVRAWSAEGATYMSGARAEDGVARRCRTVVVVVAREGAEASDEGGGAMMGGEGAEVR